MTCRGFVSGEMLLLVQKMKVLVTYCQTKLCLKLVIGNRNKFLPASFFSCYFILHNSRTDVYLFKYCHFVLVKAKQMPTTTSKLRRLVKSKHPYIEHNLASVVSIITNSMLNASAFEAVEQYLKEGKVSPTYPAAVVFN